MKIEKVLSEETCLNDNELLDLAGGSSSADNINRSIYCSCSGKGDNDNQAWGCRCKDPSRQEDPDVS